MNGREFREFRIKRNASYGQFAVYFEVSRQTIYNWEQRGTPTQGSAVRFINRLIRCMPPSLPDLPKEKNGG